MVQHDDANKGREGHGADANAGLRLCGSGFYEIHVRGQLDSRWSEWLEGLEAQYLDDGEMILSGYIVDQAALLGILNKVHRLSLTLLSVNEMRRKEI